MRRVILLTIALVFAFGLSGCSYNDLTAKQQKVKSSWAGVETQLQRPGVGRYGQVGPAAAQRVQVGGRHALAEAAGYREVVPPGAKPDRDGGCARIVNVRSFACVGRAGRSQGCADLDAIR